MVTAKWNGVVLATSNNTEIVEGNHYFPRDSVKSEYLRNSETVTSCHWKGQAKYFTLDVNGQQNNDAAWYYPEPKAEAMNIKDRVAFWKGVEITVDG